MKPRLVISYAPAGGVGPISTANLKKGREQKLHKGQPVELSHRSYKLPSAPSSICPTPSPPQARPAVAASRQLCHANATQTAHIKDLICYYYLLAIIYIYVFVFFFERWKILFCNAQLKLRKIKVKSIFMNNVTLPCYLT